MQLEQEKLMHLSLIIDTWDYWGLKPNPETVPTFPQLWEQHRLYSVPKFTTAGSSLLCLLPCPAWGAAGDQELCCTTSEVHIVLGPGGEKRVLLLPAFCLWGRSCVSVLTENQQRPSPWRIRSRENETNYSYRFRLRLYCLLIFSTLQQHVAPTALCLLPGILAQSPSGHPSWLAHYSPAWIERPLPRSII